MATDYSYLLAEYPEKISQDQLYRICRISKRKATWLLENGYIPCEDTGKKTRRFKIQITDVIAYLTRLEESPETLLTPPGIFSSGIKYKPKRQTAKAINSEKFMAILKNKWHTFPDALTVNDVTKLTGYCQTTVSEWIKAEKITGVWYYIYQVFSAKGQLDKLYGNRSLPHPSEVQKAYRAAESVSKSLNARRIHLHENRVTTLHSVTLFLYRL